MSKKKFQIKNQNAILMLNRILLPKFKKHLRGQKKNTDERLKSALRSKKEILTKGKKAILISKKNFF